MIRFFSRNSFVQFGKRLFSEALSFIEPHTKKHLDLQISLFEKHNIPWQVVKLPAGTKLVTAPFMQKPHHLNTAPSWTPEILSKFSEDEKKGLYKIIRGISPSIAVCQTIADLYCIKSFSALGVPKYYVAPKYLEVDYYLALRDILPKKELDNLNFASAKDETLKFTP